MRATAMSRSRGVRRSTVIGACAAGLLAMGMFRWLPDRAVGEEASLAGPVPVGSSGGRGKAVVRGQADEPGKGPSGAAGADREGESVGEGEGSAALAGRPRSLEGTDVDGSFDVDAGGHLVVGPRVIALFDYFFSATGEESEDAIRERIAALAAERLDEPALGEALALLDRYQAYRAAGRQLAIAPDAAAAERLTAARELRRRHFGDAAGALFGDEERAAEVAIEKSRIAQDAMLSPDEREGLLAEADERLPEPVRAARAAASSVTQLRADEQALRAAGADEAEIHRFRAGTLGPEAAERLDALDRQRAAWKARIQAVRDAREQQCAAASDPAACEAALIDAAFDERERIRARVLLARSSN